MKFETYMVALIVLSVIPAIRPAPVVCTQSDLLIRIPRGIVSSSFDQQGDSTVTDQIEVRHSVTLDHHGVQESSSLFSSIVTFVMSLLSLIATWALYFFRSFYVSIVRSYVARWIRLPALCVRLSLEVWVESEPENRRVRVLFERIGSNPAHFELASEPGPPETVSAEQVTSVDVLG